MVTQLGAGATQGMDYAESGKAPYEQFLRDVLAILPEPWGIVFAFGCLLGGVIVLVAPTAIREWRLDRQDKRRYDLARQRLQSRIERHKARNARRRGGRTKR